MLARIFKTPTFYISTRGFSALWPPKPGNKVVKTMEEALEGLDDKKTIVVGGYGGLGAPFTLLDGIAKHKAKDLHMIALHGGCQKGPFNEFVDGKKVKKFTLGDYGNNTSYVDLLKAGKIELDLIPEGVLTEKIRAGGVGIPAFYSPTGVGTLYERGGIPTKYSKDGKIIEKVNAPKERREFKRRDYLLEKTYLGDFAIVKALKADTKGNCLCKNALRNTNPDVASDGKICIVEADEIVEAGALDGDDLHIPGIFVQRVIQSEICPPCEAKPLDFDTFMQTKCKHPENKEKVLKLVKRAAQEIKGGYVTLDKGAPKFIRRFIDPKIDVDFVSPQVGVFGEIEPKDSSHCEGLLDSDFNRISLRKNAALTESSDAWAAVRGGHMQYIFTVGYQVSAKGDLANFDDGEGSHPNFASHFDLASAKNGNLIVLMPHLDYKGKPTIVNECSLKLTGVNCVKKIITDLAVFEVNEHGLNLVEIAKDTTVDDIKRKTAAGFSISKNLKKINI